VRVGTWLLLIALVGRVPCDALPTLPAILPRLPDSPWRRDEPWPQGALWDMPVLAVPGRDVASEYSPLLLWLPAPGCASDSPPSSVMISVIREEMMLGGPPRSDRGN
jgi:hypothetical protein